MSKQYNIEDMETKENNNTASTHQEKARKLKKLRRWQIVVSLLGIAILIWGIIQVTCLFLNYKRTETSNDADRAVGTLAHSGASDLPLFELQTDGNQ